MKFKILSSPIGDLRIVADQKNLLGLIFEETVNSFSKQFSLAEEGSNSIILKTEKQLEQYFKGKRKQFEIPFKLIGTDFQKRAWSALQKIPYGKTASYKEQASNIKSPNAVRVVGLANGKNPICIILPCHRIIGSNGSLTGYAGGLRAKKILLDLEGSL